MKPFTHEETLALLAATEQARQSLHHELTSLRARMRTLPTATGWAEAVDEMNRLRARVATQAHDARVARESLEAEAERLRVERDMARAEADALRAMRSER